MTQWYKLHIQSCTGLADVMLCWQEADASPTGSESSMTLKSFKSFVLASSDLPRVLEIVPIHIM